MAHSSEEGFTLAALIVILTIISMIVAYTVPEQWSMVMKRERDRQTIFVMKQYARAIMTWEVKHSGLPVSIDQIHEARKPRMIRGYEKYVCPLTGSEDDWILVPPTAIQPGGGTMPNQNGVPGLPGGPSGNPGTGSTNNGRGPTVGIGMPNGGNQQQATGAQGPSRLNPEASPKDYVGPFVGVRPNVTGPSFIKLNEAEDYSEWVYTVQDLRNEISMRQMALSTP